MTSITITVPDELAEWAKRQAAEQETSLSGLVRELLRARMEGDQPAEERLTYEAAMERYLSRPPTKISSGPYPKREDLYDRPVVR